MNIKFRYGQFADGQAHDSGFLSLVKNIYLDTGFQWSALYVMRTVDSGQGL